MSVVGEIRERDFGSTSIVIRTTKNSQKILARFWQIHLSVFYGIVLEKIQHFEAGLNVWLIIILPIMLYCVIQVVKCPVYKLFYTLKVYVKP